MKNKIKAKHQDYIYLKKVKKPKENFIFLKNIIIKNKKKNNLSILDHGCAAGEWLHYLDKEIKNSDFTGVDYSQQLINLAKKLNFHSSFKFVKKKSENFVTKKKFDVINVSGLISYYDNPNSIIKNCSQRLSKNGLLIIFDNFNQFNVDVIVRYRDNFRSKTFNKGWNIHSEKTIKKLCKNAGLKFKKSYNFKLSFDLKKTTDPTRSWVIKTNEGKMFRNGLAQIYSLNALTFIK